MFVFAAGVFLFFFCESFPLLRLRGRISPDVATRTRRKRNAYGGYGKEAEVRIDSQMKSESTSVKKNTDQTNDEARAVG